MENLLDLANRLLSDARQALKSLKKNPEKARSYLRTIRALSEEELSVVLSTFQLGQEEKAYYFNTQEKTKAIAQAAQAAAKALEEGRTKETKKFLEMIISLENTLIKQEKTRKLEIIAVSKATAEAAVLLLLRTYADPYLQYMGKQIDIIDYKISHLDELLKEKLKEVVGSFTKKVEEKPAQEETPKTEQSVLEKIQQQFEEQKQEPAEEKKAPERKPSEEKHLPAQPELIKEPEKGFFKKIAEKITTKKISSEEFEELFWDLELALLESSTSVEVIEKIKEDLKQQLANQPLKRSEVEATIVSSLRESIRSLFPAAPFNLIQRARERKPFIICLGYVVDFVE